MATGAETTLAKVHQGHLRSLPTPSRSVLRGRGIDRIEHVLTDNALALHS